MRLNFYFASICIVALLTVLSGQSKAQVDNFLVPAANRTDLVHDLATDILYIANGSEISRFDIGSQNFLAPITLPGTRLLGIDLSPDGNTLAVTDRNEANSTQNRIHVIDTNSLSTREVLFQQQSLESGTFSASFTSNDQVIVSSSFAGSGNVPLRLVTLGPDTSQVIDSVRQDTILTSSADLSVVAFAESNSSGGPFGRYRIADGDIDSAGTGSFNYEIGVNRDGTQFAVPGFSGTEFYDEDLNLLFELSPGSIEGIIGVVYSPVADLAYLAWHSFAGPRPSIEIYDTNTFELVGAIDSTDQFDWIGNNAFIEGRLEISRDGQSLFATVDGGVRVYATGVAAVPEPAATTVCLGLLLAAASRRRRS